MQSIQIDGTYTYSDNIKELKLGDQVKLYRNPSNRMNADAIGAYTFSGKKIGYVPFKSNQIDLKAKYIVSKIQLSQANPILLISMDWPNTNYIHCEPGCVTKKKLLNPSISDVPDSMVQDLKKFAKSLGKSGYVIKKIGICELSDSYITLSFQTPDSTHYFYTVTKSFYEQNIFKYDEFYKFGLIPKCIYIPWQTHRLEKYLELSYKPASKLFSGKKYSWDNLMQLEVFAGLDLISLSGPNCSMESVQSDDLVLFDTKSIPKQVEKSDLLNWAKLTIQYNTSSRIPHYNPDNLIPGSAIPLDLSKLESMFDNLEPGGLSYNHKLQSYCPIDLSDPINIVEITCEKEITQKYFIELVGKLVISNKQIINVLNPFQGILFRLEISDKIKINFSNIISKPN
jgi:hypothetical protein